MPTDTIFQWLPVYCDAFFLSIRCVTQSAAAITSSVTAIVSTSEKKVFKSVTYISFADSLTKLILSISPLANTAIGISSITNPAAVKL